MLCFFFFITVSKKKGSSHFEQVVQTRHPLEFFLKSTDKNMQRAKNIQEL
jgi:hypothetical protein